MDRVGSRDRIAGRSKLPVVEFFGFPGAGKTTVADRVAATLRGDGQRVYTVREIYRDYPWPDGWRKLRPLLLGGPKSWTFAARAMALRPPPRRPGYRIRRALHMPRFVVPLDGIRKRDPEAIVVLDEWVAHVLSGALLAGAITGAGARTVLTEYLRRYDVSFVFLELERSVAAARVAARSVKREHALEDGRENFWDGMGEERVLRAMDGFEEGYRAIRDQLSALGAPTIVLDGTRSPDTLSEEVLERCQLGAGAGQGG